MNNEHVTPEIARQRLIMARNDATQEKAAAVCNDTPDPAHCSASAGFGFSWEIVQINDDLILDHSGGDPGVKHALYLSPAARAESLSSPATLTSTTKSSKKLFPCSTQPHLSEYLR